MLGLGFTGSFTFKARIRNRLGSLVFVRERGELEGTEPVVKIVTPPPHTVRALSVIAFN